MDRDGQTIRIKVGDGEIDTTALVDEVRRPDSGATVLFLGTVRDHSNGRAGVTHLDYEVYEEFVESKIEEIVKAAASRWPILTVAVEHRSGEVLVSEVSVAVAVSTAHRADAFAAGEYIIDELKAHAPIWKKEHRPGEAEWSRGS